MKFISLFAVVLGLALGSSSISLVRAADPASPPAPATPSATPSGAAVWKTIWIKRGYVGDYDERWAGGPGKLYRKPVPLPVTGTAIKVWTRSQHAADIALESASIIQGAGPQKDGAVQGTSVPITFGGKPGLEIAQKSKEAASDEVKMAITPGMWYLQEHYSTPKCGYAYDADGFFAVPAATPDAVQTEKTIKGSVAGNIYRIDVLTTDTAPVVLCYGDSITAGAGSTPLSGKRYPEILSGLLGQPVLNMGVNGDLVLFARGISSMVKSLEGVEAVVMLMGINDIVTGQEKVPSAEEYGKIVSSVAEGVRAQGKRFYLGTITPAGGFAKFDADPAKEALRQSINEWIRAQAAAGKVDGVIDYDEALRDPAKPSQMRAEYSSGDWIHPGDKGYEKMAVTAAKVLEEKKAK